MLSVSFRQCFNFNSLDQIFSYTQGVCIESIQLLVDGRVVYKILIQTYLIVINHRSMKLE